MDDPREPENIMRELFDPYILQYMCNNLSLKDIYNLMEANYVTKVNCRIPVKDRDSIINGIQGISINMKKYQLDKPISSVHIFRMALENQEIDVLHILVDSGFNLEDYYGFSNTDYKKILSMVPNLGLDIFKIIEPAVLYENKIKEILVDQEAYDIINYLLTLEHWGEELLLVAARLGNPLMVDFLLESGVDMNYIDKDGYFLILRAIQGGLLNVVDRILTSQDDLELLLFIAIVSGQPQIGEYLVERGADIQETIDIVVEPYYYISSWIIKSIPTITFLLKHGVDINHEYRGVSLMESASMEGNIETMKFLIKSGAKPVKLSRNIIRNYNVDVVRILLQSGADVNHQDSKGNTPISYTFERHFGLSPGPIPEVRRHVEMIKLLLKHGANLLIVNNDGISMMDLAGTYRNWVLIKLLRNEPIEGIINF